MGQPKNKPKRVAYPANDKGRDFVVGDIHGCYEDLLQALTMLKFDGQVDRLFSVGDLVDRGPDSLKCANLVYETWFHAVKGNHEEMMYETLIRGSRDHAATWFGNGGQWSYDHDKNDLLQVARRLEELPYVIAVGEGENRFNLVHAEIIHTDNWKHIPVTDMMIDNWVFSKREEDDMLWGRSLISNGREKIEQCNPEDFVHDMEKMSLTFCGHTPIREPIQVQKQMYIDTGAVYNRMGKHQSEQNMLTIACPGEQVLYRYSNMWKTLTKLPFADVAKMG